MSADKEIIKSYVCPACFAKELDVCVLKYDETEQEYYCTKCAYAGKKEDVEYFFSAYQSQRYKWMDRVHPGMKRKANVGIQWPQELAHTKKIQAWVNGVEYEVLETDSSYFIPVVYRGEAKIALRFAEDTGELKISPARLHLKAERKEDIYVLELNHPQHLYMEAEGLDKPILWYGNPDKLTGDKKRAAYYYRAGAVYDIGTLLLKSGDSVYVEAGAVIRGRIHTEKYAEDITIGGYGILDASLYQDNNSRTILMDCCRNVKIEDITIIHTPGWHMLLAGCDGVTVKNVKEIGEVCGSDGVDIVGSRNVTVEDCMLRNNDDCIAVKAFEGGFCDGEGNILGGKTRSYWDSPVEHVLIENCIFMNETCGNGIEIGHELQIDEVKDIVFRNLDIVRAEGFGAAISIHAGDRAVVKDVVFEDIYIENYSDFLLDIRVMKSRFNKDKNRGSIKDILLKNIYVNHTKHHMGYTLSIIGGWDEQHRAEHIVFENFYLGDIRVENADMLEVYQRHTDQIIFR